MCRKFGYTNRESFSRMTNVDAQAIIVYLSQLEFPKIYTSSVQFALFKVSDPRAPAIIVESNVYKTYGIPTICK
jgi:predicted transcriptional regulator